MKRSFAFLAAGVALVAALIVSGVASAHAPIRIIAWDADTNPTRLTASTDARPIETSAGSFYLRVYNAGGSRVDNGDATVSADTYSISVTLHANLPAGTYRVDWLTTSTDGAVLSGSESVPLPGGLAPEVDEEDHAHNGQEEDGHEHEEGEEHADEEDEPSTPAPVSPPSTGDGGLLGQQSGGFGALSAAIATAVTLTIAGGLVLVGRKRA